jgi:hypothetical protein
LRHRLSARRTDQRRHLQTSTTQTRDSDCSVCFPLPSAAASLYIDIWFNHGAGALFPSFASSNENGRPDHDHDLTAPNALLALVAVDSHDQVTSVACSIANCYCIHCFCEFLRERSSKPQEAGQEHPCKRSIPLRHIITLPTTAAQHEVWTQFVAESSPRMGILIHQLQGPQEADQERCRSIQGWLCTRPSRYASPLSINRRPRWGRVWRCDDAVSSSWL